MSWCLPLAPLFPWAKTINKILSAEIRDDYSGPTLTFFSDYGGDQKKCPYEITGVLCMDHAASARWEMMRRRWRQTYLPDGRRMSFKQLGDKLRQRALIPFLAETENIAGVCVFVAVRKSLQRLCLPDDSTEARTALGLKLRWTDGALERACRVTHLIAMLMGGLTRSGQNVYWVSDQDSLFANPHVTGDLEKMLSRFSGYYVRHELGELGLGTTEIDEGDRYEEDNVAVVDLGIGALGEMLTAVAWKCGGYIPPELAIPYEEGFKGKTEVLSGWFAQSTSLRKVCIVFEQLPDKRMAVSRWNVS